MIPITNQLIELPSGITLPASAVGFDGPKVDAADVAKSRQSGYLADTPTGQASLSSYIAPEDEQEAKELIRKMLGFDPIRACGYYLLVAIYVRSTNLIPLFNEDGSPRMDANGKPAHVLIPDSVVKVDQYRKNVALVLGCGGDCWTHPRFARTGPLCRVGDWIIIPRNEGIPFKDRGVPMQLIPDDRCVAIVQDPSHIEEA